MEYKEKEYAIRIFVYTHRPWPIDKIQSVKSKKHCMDREKPGLNY